ncbi:MAG TPA: hypothetical protein PKH33_01890 [bacterium]|nr:hypothetical protein [bacterium]
MKKPSHISCAIAAALFCALCAVSARADSVSIEKPPVEMSGDTFEQLDRLYNHIQGPDSLIPRNHWSYGAVSHFASLGMLDGYDASKLNSSEPMTRREMAVAVNKLLDSYLEWHGTGQITSSRLVRSQKPAEISVGQISQPSARPEAAIRRVAPPLPSLVTPPNKDVTIRAEGGNVTLTRTGPRAMKIIEEPANPSEPEPEPQAEPPAPPEPQWEEKLEEVKKSIELSQKEIDTIENLVNDFQKEMKETNKNLEKKTKDVEKIALKNERSINALKREDERFKITGVDDFYFKTQEPTQDYIESQVAYYDSNTDKMKYEKVDTPTYGITKLYNRLKLKMDSKPDADANMTFSSEFEAYTSLGGRRGYFGYIEGSNTPLTIRNVSLKYINKPQDPSKMKNTRLETLSAGDNSVMYSPLTIFGRQVQGLNASFKLNDYNLNMFGGRVAQHYPFFMGSAVPYKHGDDTIYDRYLYGFNMQGSVFGEPASMGNIQKIFMFDDPHTNFYGKMGNYITGCEPGRWIDLNNWPDPSLSNQAANDEVYKDLFCLPPEKNSVTSVFIRYPTKFGVTVTTEYAHSTYFKPAYGVVKDGTYLPAWMDEDSLPEGSEIVDTNDMSLKYGKWFPSKERNEQDDAFLVLLDFSRGPVSVFPLGYARLGPEFVTKYFGLPGLDLGSAGGSDFDKDEKESSGGDLLSGLSFLPISIQSMELYLGRVSIDKIQDQNYSFNSMYLTGGEIKPMYFDPGAVAYGLSSNSSKGTSISVLSNFIGMVNTRREMLSLSVWNNGFKYYLSDKIIFNFSSTSVKAALPESCLDGNIVNINDDHGVMIDRVMGNGKYTCYDAFPERGDVLLKLDFKMVSQSYKIEWKTSKRANYTASFDISDLMLGVEFPSLPVVADIIYDLVPTGKSYKMSHKVDYKLTGSTTVLFYFEKSYDRDMYRDKYYAASDQGFESGYTYAKHPVIDEQKLMLKISTQF